MNKENLTKLAKKLAKTKPKVFSMRHFRANAQGFAEQFINKNNCGTIGCALGISALVKGLEPITADFILMSNMENALDFSNYCERVFGLKAFSPEWAWCFHADWLETDNTPTGAAKRIMELVNNGLPDNWVEQMYGD